MGAILLLLIAAVVYFIPTIAAYINKHPRADATLFLNLLLGWTLVGWVGAAIWSTSCLKQRGAQQDRQP